MCVSTKKHSLKCAYGGDVSGWQHEHGATYLIIHLMSVELVRSAPNCLSFIILFNFPFNFLLVSPVSKCPASQFCTLRKWAQPCAAFCWSPVRWTLSWTYGNRLNMKIIQRYIDGEIWTFRIIYTQSCQSVGRRASETGFSQGEFHVPLKVGLNQSISPRSRPENNTQL